jgi:hypothetical protein
MIEESLLKSNFVGRDGFRWWIGQIPPVEVQRGQANGEGWGNRVKVRIMGYHPFTNEVLTDDDLPWAQVLLPTTAGTGAGNRATNIKIQPGDTVFGFFLDGDNAQIPVILGCFGRTSLVSDEEYTNPFIPFTGYTNRINNDGSRVKDDQSNEQNAESQKSPRTLAPEKVERLNQNPPADELSYFSAIGGKVVTANSCNETIAQGIIGELENLVGRLKLPSDITDTITEVHRSVDKIQSIANGFVGQMFNTVFTKLIPIFQNGLRLLYAKVFSIVYAATPGDPSIRFAVAHAAGVQAQSALVLPIKLLEEAISCSASSVVNSLFEVVEKLIESFVENVENYTECAGAEFTSAMLNGIVDGIGNTLNPFLDAVTSIISPGFNLESLLRESVETILNLESLLDCNQSSKNKCSGNIGKYEIGKGNMSLPGNDIYGQIFNKMNEGKEIGNAVKFSTELPKSSFKKLQRNSKKTILTDTVKTTDSVFTVRNVSGIVPGQTISIGDEIMTILSVDKSTNRVFVNRPNPTKKFKEGKEVLIMGNVPAELYGTFSDPDDFKKIVGSFDVFEGSSKNPNTKGCYTGQQVTCNLPFAEVFGGGGRGCRVEPIITKTSETPDGQGRGSIWGVNILSSGSRYRYPPYIVFSDNCNLGYGAIARAVINSRGSVVDAYMISIGENYPTPVRTPGYAVVDVIVENGGNDYTPNVRVVDDLGNNYEVTIDAGVIINVDPINSGVVDVFPNLIIKDSEGSGAKLRPILEVIEFEPPADSDLEPLGPAEPTEPLPPVVPEIETTPIPPSTGIGIVPVGTTITGIPTSIAFTTQTTLLPQPFDIAPSEVTPPESFLVPQEPIEEFDPNQYLDPDVITAREKRRLRVQAIQRELKRVIDCPN